MGTSTHQGIARTRIETSASFKSEVRLLRRCNKLLLVHIRRREIIAGIFHPFGSAATSSLHFSEVVGECQPELLRLPAAINLKIIIDQVLALEAKRTGLEDIAHTH